MENITGEFAKLVKNKPQGESIIEDIPSDHETHGYTTSYEKWIESVKKDYDNHILGKEELLLNEQYGKKFKEFMTGTTSLKNGRTLIARARALKNFEELDTIPDAIFYRIVKHISTIGGYDPISFLKNDTPIIKVINYQVRYA